MSNTYNLQSLNNPDILEKAFMEASGPIDYNMTNDYMFRAILQSNERVLRKLICALLHYKPEDIKTIELKNPIILGESIEDKNFVLDINILLNSDRMVNLEMQINNLGNWPERSLSYLCRSFDNLNKGVDYTVVKPAIHIGILDFDPFPDKEPEFYAFYKMINEKNHHIYSDKFFLRVLSLKHTEYATDEDKHWKLDYWANVFKVKTWEELKMLAKKEPDFIELSKEMFKQHADETIRQQCRAREAAIARERSREEQIEQLTLKLDAANSEKKQLTLKLDAANSEKKQLTSKLDTANSEKEQLASRNKLYEQLLSQHNIPIPDELKE